MRRQVWFAARTGLGLLGMSVVLTACSAANTNITVGSTTATVRVSCGFEDGWASVLPESAWDPKEDFLMQALIGLTQEPGFWAGEAGYQRYAAYKARPCSQGATFEVPAGGYRVVVGWAGRFAVHGEYRDNGFIKVATLAAGQELRVTLTPEDLTHTWSCISCPYLQAYQDGELVDLGQVLVDRLSPRSHGTDLRRAMVDVADGELRLHIVEREPEVTHLDAVEVFAVGRRLELVSGGPDAVRRADGDFVDLSMGDSLELRFDAGGLPDGRHEVSIAVTGHYTALVPLRRGR